MGSEVIIVPGAFLMVSWIVWVIVDGLRRASQMRNATQFHGRLLERIGSAHEFGEFLATEGGAKFVASLAVEKGRSPHARILTAVQSGLVLLVLGVGIFIFVAEVELGYPAPENLAFAATVATAIGIGLLLSSLASYVLSRRMGLLNGDRGGSGSA
jgi:hypothetical protein